MTSQPPASSSHQDLLTLKIPGQAQYIGIARLAVSGLASQLDLPYDEAEDLKLAVTEVCSHILRSVGREVSLEIDCRVAAESLQIQVSSSINGDGRLSPRTSATGAEVGGDPELGMYLVEALMDRVETKTDKVTGAVAVHMARRLPAVG